MKVTFVIQCKDYLEAATTEEWLQKNGIQYEERINDGAAVHSDQQMAKKPSREKRHRVNSEIFCQVRDCKTQHPNWKPEQIKEHLKLPHSRATIYRILCGDYDTRFISEHKIRSVK